MSFLLHLPNEVLHGILVSVERQDLASLCRSCHALHNFITGDNLLWKELYLRDWSLRWDDPKDEEEFDWMTNLKELTEVEMILNSVDERIKEDSFALIIRVISDFLRRTPPGRSRNYEFLATFFDPDEGLENQKHLLTKSTLYSHEHRKWPCKRGFSPRGSLGQFSAKLHCLYGVPVSEAPSLHLFPYRSQKRLAEIPTHSYARSRVYDLRNYDRKATEWAPLMDDGSGHVDWEKMEAIMILLDYNMQLAGLRQTDMASTDPEFLTIWTRPFEGVEPKDVHSQEEGDDDDHEVADEDDSDDWMDLEVVAAPICKDVDLDLMNFDPYDVTGCWLRVVCYLDYSDFYNFNFPDKPEDMVSRYQARPPIKTMEAIRLINITLTVSRIEPAKEKDALPIVHFKGLSKLVDTHWDPEATSQIKGSVRQTPDGEIRWQTISIFHGNEERWRSEGIQIGGLRSRRAIIGSWFDKDYEEHGPLGPTAFWKIHNMPAVSSK